MSTERDVVADFCRALADRDWDLLASTLAYDLVRVGPEGTEADTHRGREAYLAYVQSVAGSMDRFDLQVRRIFYAADGRCAVSEYVEVIRFAGQDERVWSVVNLYRLDESTRIAELHVYGKPSPPD